MSAHQARDGEVTRKEFVMDKMNQENITAPGVHYKLMHGHYGPFRIRRVNKRVVFIKMLSGQATF